MRSIKVFHFFDPVAEDERANLKQKEERKKLVFQNCWQSTTKRLQNISHSEHKDDMKKVFAAEIQLNLSVIIKIIEIICLNIR